VKQNGEELMEEWKEQALELLCNPTIRFWVKAAIRDLLKRDPVDAAVDAKIVFELMDKRAKQVIWRSRA